jgi:hypothetical protein
MSTYKLRQRLKTLARCNILKIIPFKRVPPEIPPSPFPSFRHHPPPQPHRAWSKIMSTTPSSITSFNHQPHKYICIYLLLLHSFYLLLYVRKSSPLDFTTSPQHSHITTHCYKNITPTIMTSVQSARDGREWILDAYRALEPRVSFDEHRFILLFSSLNIIW